VLDARASPRWEREGETSLIEVDRLVKRYGTHRAVDGVDLRAYPGEVVALLGPNGAGKSTTIRAITGLLRPSSGRVRVCGHDVVRTPLAAKASMGYVPDRPYLYPKLTARELLRFVGRLRRLGDGDRRADAWLEAFALAPVANELIETYSHGMRQKLTFAAALLAEPPVLVVDEPMVGLDPRAARQVRELMRGHADRGHTVLLTTHAMDVAEALADRVVVLHLGRVAAHGTMAELRATASSGPPGGGHQPVAGAGRELETIFLRLTEEATNAPPPWGASTDDAGPRSPR
jgi:ABC-2 type transport system ATP-binding protein